MDNKLHNIYQWLSSLPNMNELLSKLIFGLIVSVLLLFIPIFIALIVPLVLKKPRKELSIYIYAFITGMFIILGSFGYLREAIEITSSGKGLVGQNIPIENIYIYNILVIVGGAIIGIGVASLVKFGVYKIIKSKYSKNSIFIHTHEAGHHHKGELAHEHKHEDHIFNSNDIVAVNENSKAKTKSKISALLLLLSHRIPEGLLIGISLHSLINDAQISAISVAFFVSFVLHTIPEEIVFYYRQREMGIKPLNATLISIGALALIIPFIFIGLYGGAALLQNHKLKAIIMAIVGSIMLFTSIVEFLPEFYHHNMKKKRWLLTLAMFFIGVIFTLFILSFHTHGI